MVTQKQRKAKREKKLEFTKDKIEIRSGFICEHCNCHKASDFAHNIPRKTDGYKYFSLMSNIQHWCRECHVLYDQYKVKEFSSINLDNFLSLMDYLEVNGQKKIFNNYMGKYNAPHL